MTLTAIKALVAVDLQAVDAAIQHHLSSEIPLVGHISHHIIQSGGKRLRPLLHLLSALAVGYRGTDHITLAAVIEFIHTATLLHDDVVDGSLQRRGYATANTLFGNAASVLVGDFLYSRAFQMMASLKRLEVMDILSETTNTIAEGEVLQLSYRHQPDLTEAEYFKVIRCKTAALFQASTELGAVLTPTAPVIRAALAAYGHHVGIAFQLMDDILDYEANPEDWGKNVGDDFKEGKMTLPLIYALQRVSDPQKQTIKQAIQHPEEVALEPIRALIHASGALEFCRDKCFEYTERAGKALSPLPASSAKEALWTVADSLVCRIT
jgi:octaprenyl-diphosphate synthase